MFWGFLEKIIKTLGGVSSFLSIFAFWRKKKETSSDTNQSIHVEQKEESVANGYVVVQQNEGYTLISNSGNQNAANIYNFYGGNPKNSKENKPTTESFMNTIAIYIVTALTVIAAVMDCFFSGILIALCFASAVIVLLYQFKNGQPKYRIEKGTVQASHFQKCLVVFLLPFLLLLTSELITGVSIIWEGPFTLKLFFESLIQDPHDNRSSQLNVFAGRLLGVFFFELFLLDLIQDTKTLRKNADLKKTKTTWRVMLLVSALMAGGLYWLYKGVSMLLICVIESMQSGLV